MRMISDLAIGELPVVGEMYLVPCVDLSIFRREEFFPGLPNHLTSRFPILTAVPVLGHSHKDPEFPGAGGERMHIHLDVRFIEHSEIKGWGLEEENDTLWFNHREHPGIPIVPALQDERKLTPALVAKKCHRQTPDQAVLVLSGEHYQVFEDKMENEEAAIKLDKPICPHQGTPLGGIAAVNGIVTCPLHGLGFCAKTGKMVRKTKRHDPKIGRFDDYGYPRHGSDAEPKKYQQPPKLSPEERLSGCST